MEGGEYDSFHLGKLYSPFKNITVKQQYLQDLELILVSRQPSVTPCIHFLSPTLSYVNLDFWVTQLDLVIATKLMTLKVTCSTH